ncbi:Asp23/Gls24 family envelope stress response protein [Amycolatopsis palatopharyngis]|uniref:Asp23/Gls24 family envelope stress response protein n=1 Tax=Amycolatopsis palatopharyngis TaxID=187982 RepID=UPI000E2488DE|nr:Asp23/Gls24 family envelope stress response protein [Amycolatopsis palatopharyngis]
MTTLETEIRPQPSSPSVEESQDTDRGRTTLEERAVERIAARAVSEVDGIGGSAPRVLGVAVGADEPDRTARVTARLDGDTATLEVRLSVAYPASVAATTERARSHLIRRTEELTGLRISKVDILVTALHGAVADTRRVR